MSAPPTPGAGARGRVARWWPLGALLVLAAILRLSTLDLQSFWYDEAFTPLHVLHPSLAATLRSVAHTENSPPLWYLIAWADARVLGTGELALRLPSAIAGIATVGFSWGIGYELGGRRAAIACAALTAVNPLFIWYSQEARDYGLFIALAALAMLCFLRAAGARSGAGPPQPRAMAAFALSGGLAMLTHYFAVFLLLAMVLWLLGDRARRRAALPAAGALVLLGLALLPLISAQGGHGTQWIGRWPLAQRLQAIPQYYLTGYSGAPLGHGVELLVALPIIAAVGLGLWRMFERPPQAVSRLFGAGAAAELRQQRRGALITALLVLGGVLIPVVLAALGADYLAPRNLVAAMVALTALIAMLATAPRTGAPGTALLAVIALGFLAISIDVELSPRLQRGNWRALARVLGAGGPARAISTVELGGAPLEYYLRGLRTLPPGRSVSLEQIDETGYAPLRSSAASPPAAGFTLQARLVRDGLVLYRFSSPVAQIVSEATLARHVITLAHPEVLVPDDARLYP